MPVTGADKQVPIWTESQPMCVMPVAADLGCLPPNNFKVFQCGLCACRIKTRPRHNSPFYSGRALLSVRQVQPMIVLVVGVQDHITQTTLPAIRHLWHTFDRRPCTISHVHQQQHPGFSVTSRFPSGRKVIAHGSSNEPKLSAKSFEPASP